MLRVSVIVEVVWIVGLESLGDTIGFASLQLSRHGYKGIVERPRLEVSRMSRQSHHG